MILQFTAEAGSRQGLVAAGGIAVGAEVPGIAHAFSADS
jgi:hypothetical protein